MRQGKFMGINQSRCSGTIAPPPGRREGKNRMREAWKEWEGRVVNKEFRLGEYLGGSERAGVFLTEYGPESLKAAVKLIPVGTGDQATVEAELSRLQSARELWHPHLLQIFQAGLAKLDDAELLFVVMEYAEEDLSETLPSRALTTAEVREMLKPTLEALAYLHGQGFVHGHLKPANVMAIGDQLKLSSDGILPSGEPGGAREQRSDYDPPEVARGEIVAAGDVWSLGMLLVMALTQRLPRWDASKEEPILPENVPAPFAEIARHCLRRAPGARWALTEIAARLGFGSLGEPKVAKPDLRQSRVCRAPGARWALTEIAARLGFGSLAEPKVAKPDLRQSGVRRAPGARWALTEIAARLGFGSLGEPTAAKPDLRQSRVRRAPGARSAFTEMAARLGSGRPADSTVARSDLRR